MREFENGDLRSIRCCMSVVGGTEPHSARNLRTKISSHHSHEEGEVIFCGGWLSFAGRTMNNQYITNEYIKKNC